MMGRTITQLAATNVHGQYDYDITFKQGINILFGKNGIGKTTILHILANAIQQDFQRFVAIEFDTIELTFDDGTTLKIVQSNRLKRGQSQIHYHADITASLNNEELFYEPNICENSLFGRVGDEKIELLTVAYFPAFRQLIDAFDTVQIERKQTLSDLTEQLRHNQNDKQNEPHDRQWEQKQSQIVKNARVILGNFVPYFDFPPATAIEGFLNKLLTHAITQINIVDREQFLSIFSNLFVQENGLQDNGSQISSTELKTEILALLAEYKKYPIHLEQDSWAKIESQLRDGNDSPQTEMLLPSFYRALKTIVEKQQLYLDTFDNLLSTINSFLVDKRIVFSETDDSGIRIQLLFDENKQQLSDFYPVLSPGEHHILALIYAAAQVEKNNLLLIDEPELSLHITWQRRLMSVLEKETKDAVQIIICTHSPEIAESHLDRIINLG